MKNFTLSGTAYFHNVILIPRYAYVEFAVVSDTSEANQDEVFFRVKLEEMPSKLLFMLKATKDQKVLVSYTAQYLNFASHFVDQTEERRDNNIVILNVGNFEVHDCYINGKRHESFITSAFGKAV